MKTCPRCKDELDESEFGADASRVGGLSVLCKPCTNKRARAKFKPAYGVSMGVSAATLKSQRQNKIVKYGLDMTETIESLAPIGLGELDRF